MKRTTIAIALLLAAIACSGSSAPSAPIAASDSICASLPPRDSTCAVPRPVQPPAGFPSKAGAR
jgi:hypothetical protein